MHAATSACGLLAVNIVNLRHCLIPHTSFCQSAELPFKEPVEIWAFGDPTIITATAIAPGKGMSRAVSPKYKLIERLRLPEIHPSSGVYNRCYPARPS